MSRTEPRMYLGYLRGRSSQTVATNNRAALVRQVNSLEVQEVTASYSEDGYSTPEGEKTTNGGLENVRYIYHIAAMGYTECSLCRLIKLLSMWRRRATFFSSNIHGVHCACLSHF
jgi:hypothetical protein